MTAVGGDRVVVFYGASKAVHGRTAGPFVQTLIFGGRVVRDGLNCVIWGGFVSPVVVHGVTVPVLSRPSHLPAPVASRYWSLRTGSVRPSGCSAG